jgi:hypothetical protein
MKRIEKENLKKIIIRVGAGLLALIIIMGLIFNPVSWV